MLVDDDILANIYIYTLPTGTLSFPRVCGQTPGTLVKWENLGFPGKTQGILSICLLR